MTDRSHLGPDDIAVGIDLGSQGHQAVILSASGRRLTSFRVPRSRAGLAELSRRAEPQRWQAQRVVFGFEATGHLREGVAHIFARGRGLAHLGQSAKTSWVTALIASITWCAESKMSFSSSALNLKFPRL
jgi:hypothetical protein